ncbi:hypothetical protein M1D98_09170 [Bacillus sp. K7]
MGRISISIVILAFLLGACSSQQPDLEAIKKEGDKVLDNTDLNTYITKTIYKLRKNESEKDAYYVDLNLKLNSDFAELSKVQRYKEISDAMLNILEINTLPECGSNDYEYGVITGLDEKQNKYSIDFASSYLEIRTPPININGEMLTDDVLPIDSQY